MEQTAKKTSSRLILGDCLEELFFIEDQSIDLVLTDPPYGTTACKWDSVIPFDKMWAALLPLVKPNAAICLFGSEPFSSNLRLSNAKEFKYDWIWKKNHKTGIAFSKYQPMRAHEIISVFCDGSHLFNKQMEDCADSVKKRWKDGQENKLGSKYHSNHLKTKNGIVRYKTNPSSVLFFDVVPRATGTLHPTQKPVALLEYLIKTYTNEGDTVLDFTMGSGSTGVACKNLGRNFIGIERDDKYFEIAKKRIADA